VTQRSEEWAREQGALRQTLTLEVIDESVRIPAALAHEFAGHAEGSAKAAMSKGHSVTVAYPETVAMVRKAGFHPVDPITRRLLS
jgi:hypothetical protein